MWASLKWGVDAGRPRAHRHHGKLWDFEENMLSPREGGHYAAVDPERERLSKVPLRVLHHAFLITHLPPIFCVCSCMRNGILGRLRLPQWICQQAQTLRVIRAGWVFPPANASKIFFTMHRKLTRQNVLIPFTSPPVLSSCAGGAD